MSRAIKSNNPVALYDNRLDGGVMDHEITTKTELSIDQQKRLVEIISDQTGPHLTFDEFADQMLMLFEDIAGFETISDSESQTVTDQLMEPPMFALKAPRRGAISAFQTV